MVEITILELSFPDARATAEAEFNAPFAGRGPSADSADEAEEPDDAASTGPPAAGVAALVLGLLSVAALVWLRSRSGGPADDVSADD